MIPAVTILNLALFPLKPRAPHPAKLPGHMDNSWWGTPNLHVRLEKKKKFTTKKKKREFSLPSLSPSTHPPNHINHGFRGYRDHPPPRPP